LANFEACTFLAIFLKVNHYNTYPYGGAALAARRIHHGIIAQVADWESQFYYCLDDFDTSLDSTYQRIEFLPPVKSSSAFSLFRDRLFEKPRRRRLCRQFDRHIRNRNADLETFSMSEQIQPTRLNWAQHASDIVHLHWIAYLADYPSFFQSIPDKVPLVWTLHDMNPFTGGCHYAQDCQRFQRACGHCPQLHAPAARDSSRSSFVAKQKSLRRKQIAVVCPSDWLKNLAQQSPLWPSATTFHTIRYGLELDEYYPIDKRLAKQQLGFADDVCLIAFGAEQIANPRKGFQFLTDALKELGGTHSEERQTSVIQGSPPWIQPLGLVFGGGELSLSSGIPVHRLGYLKTVEEKRRVYSAADMVVVPSLEDNQPQVALEAMACGTPVIGFNSGGVPEIVRPGQTGLLTEKHAPLSHAITELLESQPLRQKLGDQARALVVEEFEIGKQTAKYLDLYQELLKTN